MKKNEKEKVLRKQKIKNVIFNILHTLGYISMGVVLLCGIGLGVVSCKQKQNRSSEISEVTYTDVKKDDFPNNLVVMDNDTLILNMSDLFSVYLCNKIIDQYGIGTETIFSGNGNGTLPYNGQWINFINNPSNVYSGYYSRLKTVSYNGGYEIYLSQSNTTYISDDILITWNNSSARTSVSTRSTSNTWVAISGTKVLRGIKVEKSNNLNFYNVVNAYRTEIAYQNGYDEGVQNGTTINVIPTDIDLNKYRNAPLNQYYKDYIDNKKYGLLDNAEIKFNYDYIFNFILYSGVFDYSPIDPYIEINSEDSSIFESLNIDDEFNYSTNFYRIRFEILYQGSDVVYQVRGWSEGDDGLLYKKTNNFVSEDYLTDHILKYDIDDDYPLYVYIGDDNNELQFDLFNIPYSYTFDQYHYYNYPLYNIIANTFEIQNYDFIFNQNLNLSAFFTNQFQNSAVSMGTKTIAQINQSCYIVKPGQLFYSNGLYFDTMKIYCTELLDNATYYITSDNTTPRKWNLSGYMYPMMLSYENSKTGKSITAMVINYAEREGGYSVYLGSYSWTNDSYKYVSFLDKDYKPITEFFTQSDLNTYQLLNNALNSNIGNSVSANLGTSNNNVFTLFKSAFGSIVPILSMSLMPGITIGILLFLPLVVGIIILVFKLLRK